MTLHQLLKDELKAALRQKDAGRLAAIRNILAALMSEAVAKKRRPDSELPDDEASAVMKRLARQRKDSIEQFRKGGRRDLVEAEEAELRLLKSYLPQEMGADEIRKVAAAKQKELGITESSKIGQLIGAVLKETKGRADGRAVRAVVEELFQ